MLKEFYRYFLNPLILHASVLLTWYVLMLLFNIELKKNSIFGVINVKLARKKE